MGFTITLDELRQTVLACKGCNYDRYPVLQWYSDTQLGIQISHVNFPSKRCVEHIAIPFPRLLVQPQVGRGGGTGAQLYHYVRMMLVEGFKDGPVTPYSSSHISCPLPACLLSHSLSYLTSVCLLTSYPLSLSL